MSAGKLVVLEGIDGSGKSSQFRRICSRLETDGVDYHRIVFPRYSNESSSLIRMYLNGNFGSKPEDVNPYAAASFFAVDRYASFKEDWGEVYNNGGLVIADRYTTSNAVHQGSKLPIEEQDDYFRWLEDFEFNKMGIPRPDLVVYLDVSVEIALKRMEKRRAETDTTADIHESDTEYLKKCLAAADRACEHYSWHRIPYLKDGVDRDIDEKNNEIFNLILSYIS